MFNTSADGAAEGKQESTVDIKQDVRTNFTKRCPEIWFSHGDDSQLGLLKKRSLSLMSPQQKSKRQKTDQEFTHLIVLDFESTCWETDRISPPEIIEFPAVLLNIQTGQIEQEFQYFLQPSERPVLSEFCQKLTGITQDQVDNGIPLSLCLRKFTAWLGKLHIDKHLVCSGDKSIQVTRPDIKNSEAASHKGSTAALVTWSDWDLGVCLLYETKRKQISRPPALTQWIDLRATYKAFYGRKPAGLNGALNEVGIVFDGRQHSGLDDARNTARLAWQMIQDGCLLSVTKSVRTSFTGQIEKQSMPPSGPSYASLQPASARDNHVTSYSRARTPFVIAHDDDEHSIVLGCREVGSRPSMSHQDTFRKGLAERNPNLTHDTDTPSEKQWKTPRHQADTDTPSEKQWKTPRHQADIKFCKPSMRGSTMCSHVITSHTTCMASNKVSSKIPVLQQRSTSVQQHTCEYTFLAECSCTCSHLATRQPVRPVPRAACSPQLAAVQELSCAGRQQPTDTCPDVWGLATRCVCGEVLAACRSLNTTVCSKQPPVATTLCPPVAATLCPPVATTLCPPVATALCPSFAVLSSVEASIPKEFFVTELQTASDSPLIVSQSNPRTASARVPDQPLSLNTSATHFSNLRTATSQTRPTTLSTALATSQTLHANKLRTATSQTPSTNTLRTASSQIPTSILNTSITNLKTSATTLKASFTTLKTKSRSPLKTQLSTLKTPLSTLKTPFSMSKACSTLKTQMTTMTTLNTCETPASIKMSSVATLVTPNTSFKTPNTSFKTPNTSFKTTNTSFKTPNTSFKTTNTSFKTTNTSLLALNPSFKTPVGVSPTACVNVTPPLCSCGRRSKCRIVQKLGPNTGRCFFSCSVSRDPNSGCRFFQWATPDTLPQTDTHRSLGVRTRHLSLTHVKM